jgi:hypothetical protein
MSSTTIGILVSAFVFAGAIAGMLMYRIVPAGHQTTDTRDIIRLAIGMISILASLILGLLTASAKQTYDNADTQLRAYAANIIILDAALRGYGPAADPARAALRDYTQRAVHNTWPDDAAAPPAPLEDKAAGDLLETVMHLSMELQPSNEDQRTYRGQAIGLASDLVKARWTLLVNEAGTINPILLIIMVIWIAMIFLSFGLFAPRNATIVIAFAICSVSIGTSIFLILEMDTPFDGVIMVSGTSMKNALDHLKP